MNDRRAALIEATRILAQSPAAQLSYLATIGVPDVIDELALNFDDIAAAANTMLQCGEINEREHAAIGQLAQTVGSITAKRDPSLWTVDGLSNRLEWKQVRILAENCLRDFGIT